VYGHRPARRTVERGSFQQLVIDMTQADDAGN
jgi:hypothetical protein